MVNAPDAAPQAVLFDAYGTLFDVHSVALAAEQMFPGQGSALSQTWRDKQIEYSRIRSQSGRWVPFWQVTGDALHFAAARLNLPLDAAGHERLMGEYRHLSAFPENREVLLALKSRGIRAGILSNGDHEMLRLSVASAGFDGLLSPLLSAEDVQRFKTDAAVYDLGPKALGCNAGQILLVSSNGWDAIGATWYGYRTLWVNRGGLPLEQLGCMPQRIGSSLRDVLSFFPD